MYIKNINCVKSDFMLTLYVLKPLKVALLFSN